VRALHAPCALLGVALVATGCGGEARSEAGELRISAYGGATLEQGPFALSDGWAVRFEAFRVQFGDLHVAGADVPDPPRVDLTVPSNGAGSTLAELEIETGEYGGAAFAVEHIEALGRATRDGVTKRFAWSFASPTYYDDCDRVTTVSHGEQARLRISVHAEVLFATELTAPALSFDHFANADADGDGFVAQRELEVVTAPSGAASARVADSWHWLVALSRQLTRLDDGRCRTSSF
jgi:hypothetical protein